MTVPGWLAEDTPEKNRGNANYPSEAAHAACEFVKLILEWSAQDDKRAKALLARCLNNEVEWKP